MTAVAVTWGRTTPEKIREIASTFGGVEHRLELVREVGGVSYINGSIDSSPTRTAAALSAINDRPVVLIAGGSTTSTFPTNLSPTRFILHPYTLSS